MKFKNCAAHMDTLMQVGVNVDDRVLIISWVLDYFFCTVLLVWFRKFPKYYLLNVTYLFMNVIKK